MAIRFCQQCGAPLPKDEEVCPKCGARLDRRSEEEATSRDEGRVQEAPRRRMREEGPAPAPRAVSALTFFSADHMMAWILKNMLTTRGRLNRWNLFTMNLLAILFAVVACIPAAAIVFLGVMLHLGKLWFALLIPCAIQLLIVVAMGVCLTIRRLHDLGLTGWLAIVFYLPEFFGWEIVSLIFCLLLIFVPGTHGPNRYGDDPLREEDA